MIIKLKGEEENAYCPACPACCPKSKLVSLTTSPHANNCKERLTTYPVDTQATYKSLCTYFLALVAALRKPCLRVLYLMHGDLGTCEEL